MDTMKAEKDPFGIPPNAPGAKLDSGKIRPTLIFRDMARALSAVAEVATFGAKKYSEGGWLYVPEAYDRYTDAMFRHYDKEAVGEEYDRDSGLAHQAHLAWNALARLELLLRETGEPPMPAPEPYDPMRNVSDKTPLPRRTMSFESPMEEFVAFIKGTN